jgi:hypothetical protein
MTRVSNPEYKICTACREHKPLTEFQRRTGKKAGEHSRRGMCKSCVKRKNKHAVAAAAPPVPDKAAALKPQKPKPHPRSAVLPIQDPSDASSLTPTRHGMIRMRGRTDKGRRWHQEIEWELAVTLVRERAAVVVNRHTIRRLFSNKDFRRYILTRDKHICRFCGLYGDTIDHLLPRAKGGHTTPDNCVCACMACNQSKADKDVHEFVQVAQQG